MCFALSMLHDFRKWSIQIRCFQPNLGILLFINLLTDKNLGCKMQITMFFYQIQLPFYQSIQSWIRSKFFLHFFLQIAGSFASTSVLGENFVFCRSHAPGSLFGKRSIQIRSFNLRFAIYFDDFWIKIKVLCFCKASKTHILWQSFISYSWHLGNDDQFGGLRMVGISALSHLYELCCFKRW